MGEKHSFSKPMGGFGTPKSVTNSAIRGHLVAATGEFVGTFQFLFFAFLGHLMAVSQADSQAHGGTNSNTTIVYIALSYGMSLLVTVWAFYRISGGLFRYPAITVGLIITGAVPPVRGLILIPVQFLSAICVSAVVKGIVPGGDMSVIQTTIAPEVTAVQGLFLEMFFTTLLLFTVLMLAVEKSKDTFIAPIGIGLALFVAEIAGVYYTGGSLNPARSFGPCVIGGNFQSYHWIYWIGPLLGAGVAGGYYHFVKFFNYEDANPGQDSAGGDFEEDSRSRSRKEENSDAGPQLENGNRRSNGTALSNGNPRNSGNHGSQRDSRRNARSRSNGRARSGGRPQSNGHARNANNSQGYDRPSRDSRERGGLHPGFDNYR